MYNLFGGGRGPIIYKIGRAMGVTIGGDAAKISKNTHLLVIMRVGIFYKNGSSGLDKLDLIQKR